MGRRLAAAGLAILAGCGGGAAPRADPAPPDDPQPRVVHFSATDGRRLHGVLTPARRPHAPAVVLVHGLYGEPAQWDALAGDLHRAGFATLAYASRSAKEGDEAVLARDLAGALRALRDRPEVDSDRIALAGASVGATAVAYALGTRPRLPARGGVGVSPVALSRRRALRPHDLLLISDQREAANARGLRASAHRTGVTTYVAETPGHGIALLRDATVRAQAIAWLEQVTS